VLLSVFALPICLAPNQINTELQFVFFVFKEQPKKAFAKTSIKSTHYARTTENRCFM
jgi:hypothetical protein